MKIIKISGKQIKFVVIIDKITGVKTVEVLPNQLTREKCRTLAHNLKGAGKVISEEEHESLPEGQQEEQQEAQQQEQYQIL